tara:strand:- start:178 stop:528 length:351 start_codon:yes stop_codon:yes gene_type:complete
MKKLILILTLFLSSIAYAETQKKYDFWWEQLPMVCSSNDEIKRWATDNKFLPLNISYGRQGGKPDGEIVYMVIYWMNDTGQTMASVQTPDTPQQTCILFRTFDLTMNETLMNKKNY